MCGWMKWNDFVLDLVIQKASVHSSIAQVIGVRYLIKKLEVFSLMPAAFHIKAHCSLLFHSLPKIKLYADKKKMPKMMTSCFVDAFLTNENK